MLDDWIVPIKLLLNAFERFVRSCWNKFNLFKTFSNHSLLSDQHVERWWDSFNRLIQHRITLPKRCSCVIRCVGRGNWGQHGSLSTGSNKKKTSLFWVSPNNLSKTNCVPFPLHLYERHHLSRGTMLKKYHEYLIKQRAACWRTSSLGAFTCTQRKRTSKYDLRRYSEEGSGNWQHRQSWNSVWPIRRTGVPGVLLGWDRHDDWLIGWLSDWLIWWKPWRHTTTKHEGHLLLSQSTSGIFTNFSRT